MASIQTILCPVDFSPATPRQMALATDLARVLGSRLVVHHNLEKLPPGAGVGWMWAESHSGSPSQADGEQRLRDLLAQIPEGIEIEAKITHGSPTASVLAVVELVAADLVILTTHGNDSEHHASVTEQVLEEARCAVLVLHETTVDGEERPFAGAATRRQIVLVPTDLTAGSRPAVEFAFELARALPIELHLLHVAAASHAAEMDGSAWETGVLRQLAEQAPNDLDGRVVVHVACGDPSHMIAREAARLKSCCIVMGEHTRAPLRRWLTRDTSLAVLHEACCPVWYVPGQAA